MDNRTKGYIYALVALAFLVVWPIFSKLGFGYFNYQTTITLWFGTAALFSFLLLLFKRRLGEYRTLSTHWKYVLIIGIVNTLGVFTSWYALDIIGPSLHGFLMRINVVMMVFFDLLLLKERYNIKEALYAVLVILGVFLISFSRGEYIMQGIVAIIIFAICYTITRAVIKTKMHEVKPLMIVHYRAGMIFIISAMINLMTGKFVLYPSIGLLYATLPAILSAVYAHIFIFRSYKLVEISKTELIISSQPFLVLIVAYFVFGEVLTFLQWTGGIIIVAGVIGLIFARKKASDKKQYAKSIG